MASEQKAASLENELQIVRRELAVKEEVIAAKEIQTQT